MLNSKGVFSLLPILAIFVAIVAVDLTDYQLTQICVGKSMEILAYPGEPNKFIFCLNENTQVGNCRREIDPNDATATLPTCFNELQQNCKLEYCAATRPQTEYEKFVAKYCENDENWLARLPAEDCENYFICLGSGNAPVVQACPAGLHFSRVTKACEVPLKASCQSFDSMCKGKPTGYRFAATNCYDYYECRLAQPTARSCPYGQHYGVSSRKCISASNSKCVDQTERLPKCTIDDNGVYYKHPKCSKFYVCLNTVALEAQCPQEFYFDDKKQMCRKDTNGICQV